MAASSAIIDALAEPEEAVRSLTTKDLSELTTTLEGLARGMIEVTKECGVNEVNKLNRELGKHGLRLSRSFCKVQLSLAMAEGVNRGLAVDKTFIEQVEIACTRLFPSAVLTL